MFISENNITYKNSASAHTGFKVMDKYADSSAKLYFSDFIMTLHRKWFGCSLSAILVSLAKRSFDLCLALLLIVLCSPFFLILYLYIYFQGGSKTMRALSYLDRNGQPFSIMKFNNSHVGKTMRRLHLDELTKLIHIISGKLSFVGPAPVLYHKIQNPPAYVRQSIRPGLTCPYKLKKAVNLAHTNQELSDREYLCLQTLSSDITILMRSLPVLLLSNHKITTSPPDQINLLGITVHNHTMDTAVNNIITMAESDQVNQVAFVNQDCLNVSYHNAEYKKLLQNLSLVLADGIGIHIASKILGTSMADNVNGTDLFPFLCKQAEKKGISIYLLGGKEGITKQVAENLKKTYPSLVIAGFQHGYFSEKDEPALIKDINNSGADILLVALGAPKQDLWLHHHLKELQVGVCIGVGGLFDFVSGNIARAPVWLREIGLEWSYRLLQEPTRMWRRYIIGIPLFIWRIWQQRRQT